MKKIIAAVLISALAVALLAASNGGKEPARTDVSTSGQSQTDISGTDEPQPSGAQSTAEPPTEEPTEDRSETQNTGGQSEPSSSQPQTTTKNPLIETSGSDSGQPSQNDDPERYHVPHSYSYAVPKSAAVGLSWFDDAVFMGDSRSVGLVAYTGLMSTSSPRNCTKVSLTIGSYSSDAIRTVDGVSCTTAEVLRRISFSKVYIAFGLNECGWSKSGFISRYRDVIRDIKSVNPSARIYIEDILPVTAAKSASSDVFTNSRINDYNQALMELAQEEGVYFLAVSENMKTPQGTLPADEAANDGIHFGGSLCRVWLYYLRTHTG